MRISSIKQFILIATFAVFSAQVLAIDASKVPPDRQSATGLYFTSVEASEYMAKKTASTLFLDIRDPVEIFTVGMPLEVDHVVTFKYIDPTKWDDEKNTFGMKGNPDFEKGVSEQLEAKGLTKADTIILICGSGKRTAKAATALKKAGFTKVYSVIDGYQGWQEADLEYSKKLSKEKVLSK